MLTLGSARKIIIHMNEDTASEHDYLYNDVFSFLLDRGVAGATLIRAEAGFGFHHRAHSSESPGVAGQHLPIRIEFIESSETVAALLPSLCELVRDGLIEAQETTVLKMGVKEAQA
jgi:uncharacterized protein